MLQGQRALRLLASRHRSVPVSPKRLLASMMLTRGRENMFPLSQDRRALGHCFHHPGSADSVFPGFNAPIAGTNPLQGR